MPHSRKPYHDLTGEDLYQFRKAHGFSRPQVAHLLGYSGQNATDQVKWIESGAKDFRPAQQILLAAYLDGYRGDIWAEAVALKELDAAHIYHRKR